MVPDGVSVHAARILSNGLAPEAILKMVEASFRAVDELAAGAMDVIAYACLATSLVKGTAWSRDFLTQIEDRTAKPALTAAGATVEALQALRVRRVALATPYPDRINRLLPALFDEAGLEIVALRNITVQNSLEVCRLPPSSAYHLALEADDPAAQAVCIVATDFRTIDVLQDLERDLAKPVISTNQALLWKALLLAKVPTQINGYGSLLVKR